MEKGDIVHVEYEMWVKGAKNELFETNIEKVAKDNNKWSDRSKYKPMPMLVGHGRYMKGLEESILKAEAGKEYNIEISSADGVGERDPNKVRVFLLRDILRLPEFQRKDAKYPEVGMDINVDGKPGTITMIHAGRARVDFNNKLAGKTINYKYKIINKDESTEDRVKAIIEMEYGNSSDFGIKKESDGSVTVSLPDVCKYDPNWFKAKYLLVADLRDVLDIKLVRFVEEYRKKDEKKEEKKDEQKAEEKDGAKSETASDIKKENGKEDTKDEDEKKSAKKKKPEE
jgi:FKBP-type peptidyl-prolyl cis-trans isomerase SlyD